MASDVPRLSADDLRRLPAPAACPAGCVCAPLRSAGWQSVPAPLQPPGFARAGTLRDPDVDEPTFEERHAGGSRYDSPHAPVAPDWFPYNRCEVWTCRACGCGFLQYTEFGGYYVDHRLRVLDPVRVVDDRPHTAPRADAP